jgi:ribonuclease VapC
MIVATSVLAALWRNAPEAERLHAAIMRDPVRVMHAASVADAAMQLLAERGGGSDLELDALLRELEITVVPFGESLLHRTREAARSYGAGRHAANLTRGECMDYAMAAELGEPLLCVSAGMSRTDVERVAY